MEKKFHQSLFAFVLIVTLTTGCRSNSEYKRIAKAGNEYTNAVNKLLDVARDLRINSRSRRVLSSLVDIKDSTSQSNTLSNANKIDENYIKIIRDLREHNNLLSDYFRLLGKLADSNASASVQAQLFGITNNLTEVGKEVLNAVKKKDITLVQKVPNITISSKISGPLREELEKNKDTIMEQLTIQKNMLEIIGKDIEIDARQIREIEQKRVLIPMIKPAMSDEEKNLWIEQRRKLLIMDTTAKEFSEASKALGNLQALFQAFVEGKSNLNKVNTVSKEVKTFLQPIKQIKEFN